MTYNLVTMTLSLYSVLKLGYGGRKFIMYLVIQKSTPV